MSVKENFNYVQIQFDIEKELQEKVKYLFLNKKIENIKCNFFDICITFDDNTELEIGSRFSFDLANLTFKYSMKGKSNERTNFK